MGSEAHQVSWEAAQISLVIAVVVAIVAASAIALGWIDAGAAWLGGLVVTLATGVAVCNARLAR